MKILNLILILFLFNFSLIAENNTTTQTCELLSSQAFGYTGDVSGKRVYTKEEFIYNCKITTSEKGECIQDRTQIERMDLGKLKGGPVYYETEDFSGTMGDMLAVTQAYDKINGLWAGWHGFCQIGVDDDNFDWMSDPYILAGYALDMISAGYASGASSAANVANTAGSAATSSATSIATLSAQSAAEEALKAYAQQQLVQMAVCATYMGLAVGKMVEDYNSEEEPCDPIDEICDVEENGASDDGNIFTIETQKYEDMLVANPEMVDYIIVIDGEGTDMLTLKVTSPDMDLAGKSAEEAEQAKEDAKNLQLGINAALTTVQTLSCMLGGGVSGGTGTEGESEDDVLDSLTSAKSLTNLGLAAIGPFIGGINPLVGMGVSMAFNTYESLIPIDTCSDKDDAKEKGSRHESTYNALKLGLCHKIEEIVTGEDITLNKRVKKRYCCYNDKTTRIIVEQTKAQLAKDWQHCTDISPNELVQVSFKSCDSVSLDSSVNGVNLSAYASIDTRMTAYQFQNKCIDTREYMANMMARFGGETMMLDTQTLEELLEDFK